MVILERKISDGRYQQKGLVCLAGEVQAQRFTHNAMGAVGSHKVARRNHRLLALFVHGRSDARIILFNGGDRGPKPH